MIWVVLVQVFLCALGMFYSFFWLMFYGQFIARYFRFLVCFVSRVLSSIMSSVILYVKGIDFYKLIWHSTNFFVISFIYIFFSFIFFDLTLLATTRI